MILDLQALFSGTVAADGTKTGQALTATAISTNVMDLRSVSGAPALQDEGVGPLPWLIVQSLTAAAGGDAAKTVTITLETATDAGLTTGNVVHYNSGAITGATFVAGYTAVRIQLPSADYKRYMGLRYTVSASFTAFSITAYLTMDIQRNVTYPSGFSVDV